MIDVYIILIQTRQRDLRVGAVYFDREKADEEVRRLINSQGSLEVNDVWWTVRHANLHDAEVAWS